MYSRIITYDKDSSFFLFGPRGTGKSSWTKQVFSQSDQINLLDDFTYTRLLANPHLLAEFVTNPKQHIVIDEVQKIPALLDEVHKLIEDKRWRFVLTGSSARKLKRGAANLLGGRARTRYMFPFTASELGKDFNLLRAIQFGTLPACYIVADPADFLKSYVATYFKEEILAEGLTRNLAAFARFLEVASFSHGQILNISALGQDAHINQKLAESYFEILEDLLLARKLLVFSRRSKRKLMVRPKFYFFDAGVFSSIRPRGPLDNDKEIQSVALEGLVLQDFLAMNSYLNWEYQPYYWRTQSKLEVDFVFYGPRGFNAIEVKSSARVRSEDMRALDEFSNDYPEAKCFLIYGGTQRNSYKKISIIPASDWFEEYPTLVNR